MMVFAPGELDPAYAALIRSQITNDRWTMDRIFVAASDAGVDWPMFAYHIANMAGRMLVSALGGPGAGGGTGGGLRQRGRRRAGPLR